MTVLITGAAGFIGSTLAKYLNETYNIKLVLVDNLSFGYLDNLGAFYHQLHISNVSDFLEKTTEKFDVIFHFAGISSLPECEANPSYAYKNNVMETISVVEYCKKYGSRLIFSSTSAVYENNEESVLEEILEVRPSLTYASTKLAAEKVCLSAIQNYGTDITICRFFNVYGPNQDFLRKNPPFTSYLIKSYLQNDVAIIYNMRDDIKRSYIYVDDLIHSLICIMKSNPINSIINITSDFKYSTIDIIDTLNSYGKKKLKFVEGDPLKFWSKYEQLNKLKRDVILHEIYKNSVALPIKLRDIVLEPNYSFVSMNEGLKKIIEFQKVYS